MQEAVEELADRVVWGRDRYCSGSERSESFIAQQYNNTITLVHRNP